MTKNRWKIRWIVGWGLLVVPQLLLYLAGSIWVYQYGMLLHWFGLTLATALVSWWILHGLREERPPQVLPDLRWPPVGHQAWEKIEALAGRIEAEDFPLDRPERLWQVVREVLDTVARHYHPESEEPWLEIPVPYVMRVVELVARDLRAATAGYVPGAHILTIRDWQRLWRLAGWANKAYFWYRVFSFVINSPAAVVREIRDHFFGRLHGESTAALRRWAVGFCVRRAGYYAIQLYGGFLVLDEVEFAPYQTRHSRRDADEAARRQQQLDDEPLRVLVVGQVKAGKSSLINALFADYRAATDVVPRTKYVEPYVLEREGIPRAVILDTAGYDWPIASADVPGGYPTVRELARNSLGIPSLRPSPGGRGGGIGCDLLLVVCSATSAARAVDRQFLDELRTYYQDHPDEHRPATLVVLSRIDLVRPATEWDPPYNLEAPTGTKGRQILDAVETVATDLCLPVEDVVPACLLPDRIYNVEEALVPAILRHLPQAQRAKYLRCLRQFHDEEYWQRLWQQAVRAGRVVLKLVGAK